MALFCVEHARLGRYSAAKGLRSDQVNLLRRSRPDAPCATVYEGHFDTPKTKRSVRTIPLGPKALSILSVLHKRARDPDDLVFSTRSGEPLCRRNLLHRHLQPTCKKLGLPRISWHPLRHCHATLLDAAGAPLGTVQALLGHSSPEVTRQIYLHAIPAEQRRAVEGVEKLLVGPQWTQIAEVAQRPN